MGLAATQARLLFLTSRKSDIEFRQMGIAHNKLSLSRQTRAISDEYTQALNMRKYTWAVDGSTSSDKTVDVTYGLLMNPNTTNRLGQYLVSDINGRVVLSNEYADIIGGTGIGSGNGSKISAEDFLVKMMGITSEEAKKYIGGRKPITPDVAPPAESFAALNKSLTNIMGGQGIGETAFSEDLSSTITLPALNTFQDNLKIMKTSIESLEKTEEVKNNAKTQEYIKNLKKDVEVASKIIETYKANPDMDIKMKQGAVAALKTIFSGVSGITLIPNAKCHPDSNPGYGVPNTGSGGVMGWGHDKTNGSGFIAIKYINFIKELNPNFNNNFNNNIADLTSELAKELKSSATTQTNGNELTKQNLADFYLNLYDAICSKGWVRNSDITNKDTLQNGLRYNTLFLERLNSNGTWSPLSSGDASSPIRDEKNDDGVLQAEVKYKLAKSQLEDKEKNMDLEMKNLETERTALDTEIDSVKTIINKNIERSFKMFG